MNEHNYDEELKLAIKKQRNNYQGVMGVALALGEQDKWQLRELWCSGSLKWLITLADKDNFKVQGILFNYAHVPVTEMQKAIRYWIEELEDESVLKDAHQLYLSSVHQEQP